MQMPFKLALSLGIICSIGFVAQAAEQRVENRKVITRGTQQGKNGTFIQIYQDTYAYSYSVSGIQEAYLSQLGITLSDAEAGAILGKLNNGSLTEANLHDGLLITKDLITMKADQGQEWNSRKWELAKLRERFGNIGGYSADADRLPASYLGPKFEPGKFQLGNRSSMISEASRIVKLAELMEAGILPEKKVTIQGIFTSNFGTQDDSPYYDVVSKQPSTNATFNSWGQEINLITINNATLADLIAAAKALYQGASETGSPIVLDLTGNDRIGVTGKSTARRRAYTNDFVAEGAVKFDLFGEGKDRHIEWMSHEGDGFLVDDRKGLVTKAAQTDGVITGEQLFGSAGGYDNGYIKLAMVSEHNRMAMAGDKMIALHNTLKGKELDGLKVWVDKNHDARVQKDELATAASLGISEIEIFPHVVNSEKGEQLIRSTYIQRGQKKMAEDVWFAIDPKDR